MFNNSPETNFMHNSITKTVNFQTFMHKTGTTKQRIRDFWDLSILMNAKQGLEGSKAPN